MINTSSLRTIHLKNCKVFGGEKGEPQVFGEIILKGDRVSAVGDSLGTRISGSEQIDLGGAWVLPGLCDSHLHMAAGGQSLGITNLSGMCLDEIVAALKLAAKQPENLRSGWLEAFNWDEEDCCRLTAELLEDIVPGLPIIIHKRDLHGCCCSLKAFELAGVTTETFVPDGGAIGQTSDGRLNGMVYESAIGLVRRAMPAPDEPTRRNFILSAQKYCLMLGLTAVSEVLDYGNEDIYWGLNESGKLNLDIDAWVRCENWDGTARPRSSGRFRVETLKVFLDGSFGSRTAAMISPFDDGSQGGELFYADSELLDLFRAAVERGWRLAIHAIGDLAVEQACRVLSEIPKPSNGCHRIEHIQQLPAKGIEKVKACGALTSIQPIHLLDDQRWLPALIGKERCKNSFIWQSMWRQGIPIATGSDWPVATPDPLAGINATINRAYPGELPNKFFSSDEALLPWQAIRAASYGYAYATGRLSERGALSVGKQADLTIVDQPDDRLQDWSQAKVKMTISRGELFVPEK